MTEKDKFLALHEAELAITRRVFAALPQGQLSLQSSPAGRTMGALARHLILHEAWMVDAANGVFNPGPDPEEPSSIAGLQSGLEQAGASVAAALSDIDITLLNSQMNFGGHPMRRLDVLWAWLFGVVHHRGQLSVYLRLADAKVPSIYGPSADAAPGESVIN